MSLDDIINKMFNKDTLQKFLDSFSNKMRDVDSEPEVFEDEQDKKLAELNRVNLALNTLAARIKNEINKLSREAISFSTDIQREHVAVETQMYNDLILYSTTIEHLAKRIGSEQICIQVIEDIIKLCNKFAGASSLHSEAVFETKDTRAYEILQAERNIHACKLQLQKFKGLLIEFYMEINDKVFNRAYYSTDTTIHSYNEDIYLEVAKIYDETA